LTSEVNAEQEREWQRLYELIQNVLRQYGAEASEGGRTDYCLKDSNLGLYRHRMETQKPELLLPEVTYSLQKLLIENPNWEIAILLTGGGGVIILDNEIIDGLQRENLPKEFQTIVYEGSRPLGSKFAISCIRG
jgi:hypothetical protein